ncbi:hypothetical protein JNB88_17805 [Rhizobium cauense]|nr:hypothetical protein [Rhizobium cauense]
MSEWWQLAAIYQIFPRSFQDCDGDGDGEGIISRLDYLTWLGTDAIRLRPVYESPLLDGGYDVSDFRNIDPVFGTLADFDDVCLASPAGPDCALSGEWETGSRMPLCDRSQRIRSRMGKWFRAEGQQSNLSSGSKRFDRSAPMPVRTKRNSGKSRQIAVLCPSCSFIGEQI